MPNNLRGILGPAWQIAQCGLPYPDLPRRMRVRRAAARIAAGKPFPDSDATGAEAATIALLRALQLQKQTRRAVRMRNSEAAALLARSAVDACVIGLHCLYREGAVKELDGAETRGVGRVLAWLPGTGLVNQENIDAVIGAMGEKGPDLRLGNIAADLRDQHEVGTAVSLYQRFYVPLSHFFAHSSESALTRHVVRGRTRKRVRSAWAHRPPARVADACVGVLAAHFAQETGQGDATMFGRHADAHLDRAVPPATTVAIKGFIRLVPWRKVPSWAWESRQMRAYLRGAGKDAAKSEVEQRVRALYEAMVASVDLGLAPDVVQSGVDFVVNKVVSNWTAADAEPGGGAPEPSPS